MRMIDKIATKNQILWDAIKTAQVVFIDNVAEFFWDSKKEDFDVTKDFPNVTPPFELMWLEYKADFVRRLIAQKQHIEHVGILLEAKELPAGESAYRVSLAVFFDAQNIISRPFGYVVFDVADNGSIIGPSVEVHAPEEHLKLLLDGFTSFFGPALLAISFMHCRNVKITERGGRKPGEPRKRRSSISHYVLEIDPIKKILDSEGQVSKTGIKQALHICRGHFKDFGRGKGLFGKHKGLYWWSSQVRGNIEQGLVSKDYQVNGDDNE